MSAMVAVYVNLIRAGRKQLSDVPKSLRDKVQEALEQQD